jgi:predicted RNase H-like HicB family nuclease
MDKHTLFQKLNIPELNEIQKETLAYFEENPELENYEADEDYFVHIPLLPKIKQFLEARAKLEINETSVYFIPARSKTKIHIDGLKKDNGKVPEGAIISHQYVLIVPIENCTESVNYWYSNSDVADDQENIHNHIRDQYPYSFFVSFVKDGIEPAPIGSTVMDLPAFIKSNIYHRVDNTNNPNVRKVLVIRFKELEYYDNLDSVFNYTDLV